MVLLDPCQSAGISASFAVESILGSGDCQLVDGLPNIADQLRTPSHSGIEYIH